MQWFIQNAQILIIGFVILSSILGPVFKWLGEKRQQLRMENERKRRELEELRTGRPAQTGPTPEEVEQMIAEQVAAQRAEMLRQRAEQAEARRRAAQERAEARARQQQAQQEAQPQPAPIATQVQSDRPRRTRPQKQRVGPAPMQPHKLGSLGPAVGVRAGRVSTSTPSAPIVGKLGPEELRKAIVLTEILGPPVAMRQSDH